MDGKQHGLSHGVRQIIERIFSDAAFKEDVLTNPELAFAHYSLDAEERQALKSLLGNMGRHSSFAIKDKQLTFWD
ncbi:MAG TPA: hypothetical protein VKT82_32480 [Ktedonobacterales bacterium]|nr:hypothetical protein [Ktedonobacterales bacterium]